MANIILVIFIIGYLAIASEHFIKVNKTASALLTAIICWTIYVVSSNDIIHISHQLEVQLSEISAILFFLLGAMTIVELIDVHNGFDIITNQIKTTSKRKLLWIICIITFFLSAILDNLTTAIVMVTLLRKIIPEKKDRLLFAGLIIIAANAGGAWSPIGDVTTTMLWIANRITSANIIIKLIVPSLVCLFVPLIISTFMLKGEIAKKEIVKAEKKSTTIIERNIIFWVGVCSLIFVPIFKTVTHLPPYMGMLFSLGLLWLITEIIHKSKEDNYRRKHSAVNALQSIDTPSILFFLGILLCVGVLQAIGLLNNLSGFLADTLKTDNKIAITLGLLSSVIDNVPLVAASINMYPLTQYPTDHYFWEFLAYTTGTGGSALIIGSAAGVAAMGIEKIEFFWYFKRISLLALAGYFAGAVVYILQNEIL